MNRRRILAAVGCTLSASYSGCLDSRDGDTADHVTPTAATTAAVSDSCSLADYPLSARFTAEPVESSFCFDGATPSLAIENERAETLTATVDIDDADGITETYTLEPDQRVVEQNAFTVQPEVTGTVTVDGETDHRVEWPERSCYRHGITLTPDGIEIGWIEPLSGPGDTEHDCYAGDDAILRVYSLGESRTIRVTIDDLCTDAAVTETFEIDADEGEIADGVVTNGGLYDVTVDVDGGKSKTDEFSEGCWGAEIIVDEDGGIRSGEIDVH